MCNFREVLEFVGKLFETRTIEGLKADKVDDYEDGRYNAVFCILVRDGGKLACVWVGNRRKDKYGKKEGRRVLVKAGELEILRISVNKIREGFSPDEWDSIGLQVLPFHKAHMEA